MNLRGKAKSRARGTQRGGRSLGVPKRTGPENSHHEKKNVGCTLETHVVIYVNYISKNEVPGGSVSSPALPASPGPTQWQFPLSATRWRAITAEDLHPREPDPAQVEPAARASGRWAPAGPGPSPEGVGKAIAERLWAHYCSEASILPPNGGKECNLKQRGILHLIRPENISRLGNARVAQIRKRRHPEASPAGGGHHACPGEGSDVTTPGDVCQGSAVAGEMPEDVPASTGGWALEAAHTWEGGWQNVGGEKDRKADELRSTNLHTH